MNLSLEAQVYCRLGTLVKFILFIEQSQTIIHEKPSFGLYILTTTSSFTLPSRVFELYLEEYERIE